MCHCTCVIVQFFPNHRAASQTSAMGHPNNQKRTISETCKVVTESLPELLDSAPSTLQYNQESGKDLGSTIVKIEQSDSALTLLADLIKSSQEGNSPEEQNNSSSDDHIPNSKSLQVNYIHLTHNVIVIFEINYCGSFGFWQFFCGVTWLEHNFSRSLRILYFHKILMMLM